jgi:hypothetical protein
MPAANFSVKIKQQQTKKKKMTKGVDSVRGPVEVLKKDEIRRSHHHCD